MSQDAAVALQRLRVELRSIDDIRVSKSIYLSLPTDMPRMCSRPLARSLRQIVPEIIEIDFDNDESDKQRACVCWRVPMSSYETVICWAEQVWQAHGLQGEAREAISLPPWLRHLMAEQQPQPSSPVTKPLFYELPTAADLLPYQRDGVEFGISRGGRCLLADDMGLGKTVQAIGICWQFQDAWPVLVVAPSSLRGVWKHQLQRWAGLPPEEVQVIYNSNALIYSTSKWVVVSYALLAKCPELQLFSGRPYKVLVCDECHYIKNTGSKRSQAVDQTAKAATHVILISGTPLLNTAMELYPLLSILDDRVTNENEFGARYFKGTERVNGGKLKWFGPRREMELHTYLFSEIGLRRKKEDVLKQLPPKRRQVIHLTENECTMTMKRLKKLEDKLFGANGQEENHASKADKDQILDLVMQAKQRCCCEYVEQLIDGGCGKFLLFAHHKAMLNALEAGLKHRLGGGGYVRIDGSTPQIQRPDLVERFQCDLECHAALLSITALAEGQTLTSAEAVIFAELSWVPGLCLQCEARAHRLGQKGSVLVQYLLLESSRADLRCFELVEEKHRHSSMILDGAAPERMWEEDALSRSEAMKHACAGVDLQSLRAKSRAKPLTARGAHPKSRAAPAVMGSGELSWATSGEAPHGPFQKPKETLHVAAAKAKAAELNSEASSSHIVLSPQGAQVTPAQAKSAQGKSGTAKTQATLAKKGNAPQRTEASDLYTVLQHLHLGLNVKIGQSYSETELQKRCKGDAQKLARLRFFIQEGTKLKRKRPEDQLSDDGLPTSAACGAPRKRNRPEASDGDTPVGLF